MGRRPRARAFSSIARRAVSEAGRALMRPRLRRLALGIILVGVGLSGAPGAAQRPPRPIQIGALTESWGPTPAIIGLRDGLVALGYREDRDFTVGIRFTQGESGELLTAARELVRRGADIIVTTEGGNTAKAAQMATDRIPIAFIGGGGARGAAGGGSAPPPAPAPPGGAPAPPPRRRPPPGRRQRE